MSKPATGNRYSNDFKQQIYELYNSGQSVTKLSREYGIPNGTIYKWISELKPLSVTDEGTPVNKKEMEAMRKRIREFEMENEILKKATAIFARKP
ncbi:MAG: transposase [Bacilli bacterium]|nr:transposase [Bacilli bacterium]